MQIEMKVVKFEYFQFDLAGSISLLWARALSELSTNNESSGVTSYLSITKHFSIVVISGSKLKLPLICEVTTRW